MSALISSSEKDFVRVGCEAGVRSDGRGLNDFRSISLESGMFPHTYGSSRVKLSGVSEVLCSIKVEVSQVVREEVKHGIVVNVDVSPACTTNLEEGSTDKLEERVSNIISRSIINCSSFPWKELSIVPSKFQWSLFIDILILQMDGDPTDVCSLATYLAFQDLKLPKVHPIVGENGVMEDFEVVSDLASSLRPDFSGLPLIIAIGKIGKSLVIDCTAVEVSCTEKMIYTGIDRNMNCCLVDVIGGGTMTIDTTLAAINIACDAGADFFKTIRTYLTTLDSLEGTNGKFAEILSAGVGLLE